jgi:hypothetical protein
MPNAPKSRDFDDLDDYAAAMGVFVAEKIAEERSNAVYDARSSADRDAHVRVRQWETEASEGLQRATAELERDPEIMARIDPRLQALKPLHEVPAGQATAAHYIKEQVLRRAEHPLAVLAALCADDSAELRRIGQLRPEAMIYELAKLDARSGASDPQADTAAATPPRKSMAPAPAPTLGTKPAAAKDPRKPPSSYDEFDAWNLAETKAEPSRYGR